MFFSTLGLVCQSFFLMIEENNKWAKILKFYIKPDWHFCGRWWQISKPWENEQPPHQPHPSVRNKVQRRYCLLTPPYVAGHWWPLTLVCWGPCRWWEIKTRRRGRERQKWLDWGERRSWLRCQRCRSTSSTRTKNCSSKVWRSWRPLHLLLRVPGEHTWKDQLHTKPHLVTCDQIQFLQDFGDVIANGGGFINNSLYFPFLSSSAPSSEPSSVSQMCVGPRRMGGADRREPVTCILCQEEQEVRSQGRAMVLAAFVQRSTVLSKNRQRTLPDPGE